MRTGVLAVALLFAASLNAGPTIHFFNSSRRQSVEVVWTRLTPLPRSVKRITLEPEEHFDTGVPVGNGEVYSIVFERDGTPVARPVVGTGFETASLLHPSGEAAYVALRPVYDERIWADVGAAMGLSGGPRPTSLVCTTVEVRRWNDRRVAVLANGAILELTGPAAAAAKEGRHCFCGRGLAPPRGELLDRFDAGSTCRTALHPPETMTQHERPGGAADFSPPSNRQFDGLKRIVEGARLERDFSTRP